MPFLMYLDHSSIFLLFDDTPEGEINNAVAPIIAIMVSSSLINPVALIISFVIHKNAVEQKIINTLFSATSNGPSSSILVLINSFVESSDLR